MQAPEPQPTVETIHAPRLEGHRAATKGTIPPRKIVETNQDAIWVKPVVTCRLSYVETQTGERLDVAIEAFVLNQRGSRD